MELKTPCPRGLYGPADQFPPSTKSAAHFKVSPRGIYGRFIQAFIFRPSYALPASRTLTQSAPAEPCSKSTTTSYSRALGSPASDENGLHDARRKDNTWTWSSLFYWISQILEHGSEWASSYPTTIDSISTKDMMSQMRVNDMESYYLLLRQIPLDQDARNIFTLHCDLHCLQFDLGAYQGMNGLVWSLASTIGSTVVRDNTTIRDHSDDRGSGWCFCI
jgi:hypothetical protein